MYWDQIEHLLRIVYQLKVYILMFLYMSVAFFLGGGASPVILGPLPCHAEIYGALRWFSTTTEKKSFYLTFKNCYIIKRPRMKDLHRI